MPKFEVHCEDCIRELGEPFEEVHKWLDECSQYMDGIEHRKYRHHKDGVKEVRLKWGDRAAKAAEIHIMKDMPFLSRVPEYGDYKDGNMEKRYYAYYESLGMC